MAIKAEVKAGRIMKGAGLLLLLLGSFALLVSIPAPFGHMPSRLAPQPPPPSPPPPLSPATPPLPPTTASPTIYWFGPWAYDPPPTFSTRTTLLATSSFLLLLCLLLRLTRPAGHTAYLPATAPPYLSDTPRRRWAAPRRWAASARRIELCEGEVGAKALIEGEGGEAAATAEEACLSRAVRWAVGGLVMAAACALLALAALWLAMAPDEVSLNLTLILTL